MELQNSSFNISSTLSSLSFIDQYREEDGEAETPEASGNDGKSPVCDVCKVWDKPTRSVCVECNEFLCSHCETAHRGSRATQQHQISSVDEVCRQHQCILEETLQQVLTAKQDVALKRMHNREVINNAHESELDQVRQVNAIREEIKSRVDRHHDEIIDIVRHLNREHIATLDQREVSLDRRSNLLDKSIQMLSNTLQNQDLLWSIDTVKSLQADVEQELSQADTYLVECTKNFDRSPVSIEPGEDWDPIKSTRLKVDGREGREVQDLHQHTVGYVAQGRRTMESTEENINGGSAEQLHNAAFSEPTDVHRLDGESELNKRDREDATDSPSDVFDDDAPVDGPRRSERRVDRKKGEEERELNRCPVCDMTFDPGRTPEGQFSQHVELHFILTKDCPMCGKKYSSDTGSDVYEQHVNSHFI